MENLKDESITLLNIDKNANKLINILPKCQNVGRTKHDNFENTKYKMWISIRCLNVLIDQSEIKLILEWNGM